MLRGREVEAGEAVFGPGIEGPPVPLTDDRG